jgi:polyhydroxyalkanoate synthesis regulator phasin
MDKHRYQMIEPMIGNAIFVSSLKKASKKCYKDLKKHGQLGGKLFALKDIDTHETYTFKLNNHNSQNNHTSQNGGDIESLIRTNTHVTEQPNVSALESKIESLESRLSRLESKINIENDI